MLVQDEFELGGTCEIAWRMTTDAQIDAGSGTALLRLDGKALTVRILSPSDAVFTVESALQEPPQKTNAGVNRLMIRLRGRSGKVRVAVLFSPHWDDGIIIEDAELKPLDAWN